jgi:hypothetical protein
VCRHLRLASTNELSQSHFTAMVEPTTVPCQECGVELAADSPELRLELTCDDEPTVYCTDCFEREFGGSGHS